MTDARDESCCMYCMWHVIDEMKRGVRCGWCAWFEMWDVSDVSDVRCEMSMMWWKTVKGWGGKQMWGEMWVMWRDVIWDVSDVVACDVKCEWCVMWDATDVVKCDERWDVRHGVKCERYEWYEMWYVNDVVKGDVGSEWCDEMSCEMWQMWCYVMWDVNDVVKCGGIKTPYVVCFSKKLPLTEQISTRLLFYVCKPKKDLVSSVCFHCVWLCLGFVARIICLLRISV